MSAALAARKFLSKKRYGLYKVVRRVLTVLNAAAAGTMLRMTLLVRVGTVTSPAYTTPLVAYGWSRVRRAA